MKYLFTLNALRITISIILLNLLLPCTAEVIFYNDYEDTPPGPSEETTIRQTYAPYKHGRRYSNNIIVNDENSIRGNYLKVRYPAHEQGGATVYTSLNGQYTSLYCSFYVMFPPDFDPQTGSVRKDGKLGYGLGGGSVPTGGKGNDAKDGKGFSVRPYFIWEKNEEKVRPKVYIYWMEQKGDFGAGWSFDDLSFRFNRGVWYKWTTQVILNIPGKSDGSVKIWIDGNITLNKSGLTFRNDDKWGIDHAFLSTFFGGDASRYPDVDSYINFDEYMVHTEFNDKPVKRANKGTELPIALRNVNVNSSEQLREALTAAIPGDHIILADGDYEGQGDWLKSGTPLAPVVVRAENLLEARITGNFNPNGNDLIIYGLDFVNSTVRVGQKTQSDRVNIWRCRWRDRPPPSTDIALRTDKTDSLDIAYCEWVNWAGRGISFAIVAGTRNATARNCLFHNAPDQRYPNGSQYNATEAIQIGFGVKDAPLHSGVRIEFCRFYKWSSDDEVISVKTSGVLVKNNSLEYCLGTICNRCGQHNRYESNELRSCYGVWNMDGNNVWIGNKQTDNSMNIRTQNWEIFAGTYNAGDYPPADGSHQPASVNCVYTGNETNSTLRVGYAPGWGGNKAQYPAHNTTIRQHKGPVDLQSGLHTGTDNRPETPDTTYTWAPVIWLTEKDVGPFADHSLRFSATKK